MSNPEALKKFPSPERELSGKVSRALSVRLASILVASLLPVRPKDDLVPPRYISPILGKEYPVTPEGWDEMKINKLAYGGSWQKIERLKK